MKQVKGKKIWTPDEDEMIKRIVKEESEPNWKLISEKVNKLKLTRKTPKQCRERFRNYLVREGQDPVWSNTEKLVFAVLYSQIGNKWMTLSRFIPKKTDIAIKNYHYQIIRTSVRNLYESSLEEATQSKLPELFCLFSTLELIRNRYFKGVERKSSSNREDNEKMVLKILKTRKVNKDVITKYEILLKEKILSESLDERPPFPIRVELEELELPPDVMLELMNILNKNSNPIIDALFKVSILNSIPIPIPSEVASQEKKTEPSKIKGNQENLASPEMNNLWERRLPSLQTSNFPIQTQREHQALLPRHPIQYLNHWNYPNFQQSYHIPPPSYNISPFSSFNLHYYPGGTGSILHPPRAYFPSASPYLFTTLPSPYGT